MRNYKTVSGWLRAVESLSNQIVEDKKDFENFTIEQQRWIMDLSADIDNGLGEIPGYIKNDKR